MEINRSERDGDVRAKFLQIENTLTTMETNIATIATHQKILKARTATIELDIMKTKKIITNPEELLQFLLPPANGHSFGASTFEQIAAALPSHSMAVKL
ncbi:unnamed protein product, partial [Allacma fusca]